MEKRKEAGLVLGLCAAVVVVVMAIGLVLQAMPKRMMRTEIEDSCPVVVWNVGDWYQDDTEFEVKYNKLLQKYGCEYRVDFQELNLDLSAETEIYGNSGNVDAYTEEVFEKADILTLPVASPFVDYYSFYGFQNRFLDLRDLLETNVGQKLKASYPEKVWKASEINGLVFGVGNIYMDRNCFLVLNKEIIENYSADLNETSLMEWLNQIEMWVKTEKQNYNRSMAGLVLLDSPYVLPGDTPLTPLGGLVLSEKNGTFQAESLFYQETYLEYLRKFDDGRKNGYVSQVWNPQMQSGNFGGCLKYSYSAEAAVGYVKDTYECGEDVDLVAVHLYELDVPFCGQGNYTTISVQTKLPEGAFEVLAYSYSVPELSQALADGVADRLGNNLLIQPKPYEPENRRELLQKQFEEEKNSPLLSFWLDILPMKEVWLKTLGANWDHFDMRLGCTDDMEVEIRENQDAMREAGLEEVLKEINRQLAEWQATKGGGES